METPKPKYKKNEITEYIGKHWPFIITEEPLTFVSNDGKTEFKYKGQFHDGHGDDKMVGVFTIHESQLKLLSQSDYDSFTYFLQMQEQKRQRGGRIKQRKGNKTKKAIRTRRHKMDIKRR